MKDQLHALARAMVDEAAQRKQRVLFPLNRAVVTPRVYVAHVEDRFHVVNSLGVLQRGEPYMRVRPSVEGTVVALEAELGAWLEYELSSGLVVTERVARLLISDALEAYSGEQPAGEHLFFVVGQMPLCIRELGRVAQQYAPTQWPEEPDDMALVMGAIANMAKGSGADTVLVSTGARCAVARALFYTGVAPSTLFGGINAAMALYDDQSGCIAALAHA